ncbi:hypothetical protein Tco_0357939 [Tanacetum coccineum]
MIARISIRDEPSISLPSKEEVERLLALTTPPPSPLTPLSSPLPHIPSPTPNSPTCNTPKLGRSGIRVRGVLLLRSITQDVYRTTKKSFENDTLDLTK